MRVSVRLAMREEQIFRPLMLEESGESQPRLYVVYASLTDIHSNIISTEPIDFCEEESLGRTMVAISEELGDQYWVGCRPEDQVPQADWQKLCARLEAMGSANEETIKAESECELCSGRGFFICGDECGDCANCYGNGKA